MAMRVNRHIRSNVTFYRVLTSPENTYVRYVRSLQKKRVRYQEQRLVIEGLRLVTHAMRCGYQPAFVFYTEDFSTGDEGRGLMQALAASPAVLWMVSPGVMAALAETVTPQGILAVVPMPHWTLDVLLHSTLVLVLDNLRDPGNLGTILRTAQATHVEAVLLSEGCVDPYAPKVVRAGMGAHFTLPLFTDLTWDEIAAALSGKRCLLADAFSGQTPWEVDWGMATALIVSNEAHGASAAARQLAPCSVRLPMAQEVESLNVAIATAVLLFESEHQRRYRN
jgi:RNA methyltransferase, TrmH family